MPGKKETKKPAPIKTSSRASETVTVSDDTLEDTPSRVLDLLKGIGKNRAIRAILGRVGYTQEEHARGWNLLQKASGFIHNTPESDEPNDVADAIAQIDAWDERGFATASAALKHRHPEQHRFLFDNLSASQGPEAVIGVQRFLDRLDTLEKGEGRKATREADQAALATLTARGIHAAERKRLRELITKARTLIEDDLSDEDRNQQERQAQREALLELRAWYEEWSGIARVQLSRKEHLIRVGLAQRKKAKSDKKAQPEPTPT